MAIRQIFEDSVIIKINPSQNFCTIQYMILDALGKYTKSAYRYNFPCVILVTKYSGPSPIQTSSIWPIRSDWVMTVPLECFAGNVS